MTRRAAGALVFAVAASAVPAAAHAQAGLVVTVRSALSEAPIAGALVATQRLGRTERTDRVGTARFSSLPRPDTIVIAAIGFQPDTLVVSSAVRMLEARLAPRPMQLAELTTSADGRLGLTPSVTGEWRMPAAMVRAVPAAVLPDPLRALAVVPSVSFSSPLSGRPIIRGYDASSSVVRVDGFEVLNPYHLGRVFSTFSADAIESISVAPVPAGAADGGTVAGVIDVRGRRSADGPDTDAGAHLSLVSVGGWLGSRKPAPLFLAPRAAFIEPVTGIIAEEVPYDFQDLYGHAAFGLGGRRSWGLTLFASRDEFAERDRGSGMDWSNLLIGNRWRLVDSPSGSLDLTASANRFVLDGTHVEVQDSHIDLANRFTRLTAGLSARRGFGPIAVSGGATVGRREVTNVVVVHDGNDVEPAERESRLREFRAFGEMRITSGPITGTLGLRLDASETATAWQPRLRIALPLTKRLSAAVSAGRASRLYQIITDPQAEPTIGFYSLWFNAGDEGVPVPRVDYLTLELDGALSREWSAHAAAFFTRGSGLGELRPRFDRQPGESTLRYGRSRTRGLELRLAWQPMGSELSSALSYVLSHSERQWDGSDWVPWRLDRRHNLRLQLEAPLGSRWRIFAAGEFLSGQPITPVQEVVWRDPPPLDAEPPRTPRDIGFIYGAEGSGRSAGTFHIDVGARLQFGGPWGSRAELGISVLNLGFTPVAPEEPLGPFEALGPGGDGMSDGAPYKRVYSMPPVPSVTLRVAF